MFYGLGYVGADPRPGSALTLLESHWHPNDYSQDGAIGSGYLNGLQFFSVARVFTLSTAPNNWTIGEVRPDPWSKGNLVVTYPIDRIA